MQEIIFQHGWGLDSDIFKNFYPDKNTVLQFANRGYFSIKCSPTFLYQDSFKVLVVHSLGLHLASPHLFDSCDLLVILSSFASFLSTTHRRESLAAVATTQKYIHQDSSLLLKNFYLNMGLPSSYPVKNTHLLPLLQEDFLLLYKEHDLSRVKKIPHIMIFHGKNDEIVPLSKGEELASFLPSSTFYPISGANHALPYTHAHLTSELIRTFPFKKKVMQSFSFHSSSYEEKAHMQKKAAAPLLNPLNSISSLPPGPILEIGSGSGNLSTSLRSIFPNSPILFSDISPNMLMMTKKKCLHPQSAYRLFDGEYLFEKEEYSLIASALTLGWFSDPYRAVLRWLQGVKKGGYLLFSFIEESSFPEWKKAALHASLPYTANPLPSSRKMEKILRQYPHESFHETFIEEYDSPLSFFKHLKEIGRRTSKMEKKLRVHELKKILSTWQFLYPKTQITYHVSYCLVKKT